MKASNVTNLKCSSSSSISKTSTLGRVWVFQLSFDLSEFQRKTEINRDEVRKKNVYLSVVSKENRGRNDKKEEIFLIKTWNKNENFIFVFCGEFLLTLCVGLKCKMYFAQQSNNQTIFIFSFFNSWNFFWMFLSFHTRISGLAWLWFFSNYNLSFKIFEVYFSLSVTFNSI